MNSSWFEIAMRLMNKERRKGVLCVFKKFGAKLTVGENCIVVFVV